MQIFESEAGVKYLRFEMEDLIRMNRASHELKFSEYKTWYFEIQESLRPLFIEKLFMYGTEYNDGAMWNESLKAADINVDSDLYKTLDNFSSDNYAVGSYEWVLCRIKGIKQLAIDSSDEDKLKLLKLAGAYFGLNEYDRYQVCHPPNPRCTHWWHQNLSDPKVVEKLLEKE